MEEKPKNTPRIKDKRQAFSQDAPKKINKHQGLLKSDTSQLSPPLPCEGNSPVKKLLSETSKIVKIGMEKDFALLKIDNTLQNSNETIETLRKNMLHLQMEYEKLDQNFQREVYCRTEVVKRMDATRELVESIVQCSNVLAASIKQLEEDKLKIAEFYELIYQNQKEVEAKHAQAEKIMNEHEILVKAKIEEIEKFQNQIVTQQSDTTSQLNKKLSYANDKLKIMTDENEKLGKKVQELQESHNKLQMILEQQERLNCLHRENIVQLTLNLKKLKTQRFKYRKLLNNKKKQLSDVVFMNKNLKKSWEKMDTSCKKFVSIKKSLELKNDEWRTRFEKQLEEDGIERQRLQAQKQELINQMANKELQIVDLNKENKNLSEKLVELTTKEQNKHIELKQVQNELSKILSENLKLKEDMTKLNEENREKGKIISQLEIKANSVNDDLNSQIEFFKTESVRLEEIVKKLESQLSYVKGNFASEKAQMEKIIFDLNYKLEENMKTYTQKISYLEGLLKDNADIIRKLECENRHTASNDKIALDELENDLQLQLHKNNELNQNFENMKKHCEDVNKQLKDAQKQISDYEEKFIELNSLNKTLERDKSEFEKNAMNLKVEIEVQKKSLKELEKKCKTAEKELTKMQKLEEENAALKLSTADLKKLLEAAEARLEAYKIVIKRLETERAEIKNIHSEEVSKLKLELSHLEETLKKEKFRLQTPQKNLKNTENEPHVGDQKLHQTTISPLQSGKKFLSTPRKILTSTPQPSFRNMTPVQKKRDPYEFDSDSSVERLDRLSSKTNCSTQNKFSCRSFSGMKHSRNELVKYNVGSYMKRRHYSDNENFKKSDLVLIKTASHMTLSSVVENESSHVNSIMYSCINNDPAVAESQFSKLKIWINELNPPEIREELKALLFPLLCHLYIEMLRGGHKTAAITFLKKNQSISTNEEAILTLEDLASVESTKDIEEKDIIQSLRSSKYLLMLSPTSIEILKQYLIRKSHIVLLQMINCWFDIEEKKSGDLNVLESEENEPINQPCNGFPEIQPSDGDLAKLEEIIKLVNDVPSSSGPLLLYSVLNPDNCMTCGHVSDDTFFLAAGFNTSEIKLWSLTEKKLLSHKPCSSSRIKLAVDIDEPELETEHANVNTPVDNITLRSHSGQVQDLAFIPKEDILVSVSMDKTMRAWDLKTYSCRATYRGHNYPVWAVDVSPLGVYVATGSHDKTARLWSLERNYPLRIFAGHVQDVDCLRFHPNGSYLATGSSDKSVRLWSTSSGELMRVLPGHRGGIYALSFSPNGKLLASAGEDKRIKIWDIASSNVITELKGHSGTVISLDWSPNGDFLASCSFDNTCRIWNMKNCSSEDEVALQVPELHNIACNSLFSVKYSSRNTPICVAGV